MVAQLNGYSNNHWIVYFKLANLWFGYDMIMTWVIKSWVGLPWWLSGKEFACQCRRCTSLGFDPWVWKITGEGNGNPLQYPCLRKPMDRRAWRAIVHEVAESDVTMWLTTSYTCCAVLCWVTQLCLTLCDPMDCSMPGLSVHHQLPKLAQTHVHRLNDAIQPSHPLSSPSPPAVSLSRHQGLFK